MNLSLKNNLVKVFFLCVGLLLVTESCSVQKRRYRKGWTINWRGEQKSDGARIPDKDSLKYTSEIEATTITSTKEDLGLIVAKSTLKSDSVAQATEIREIISNKTVEKERDFEPKANGEKDQKSRILDQNKPDEPKDKKESNHRIFIALGVIMLFLAVAAALILSPVFLSSVGVASLWIHANLRWFIAVIFFILGAVFLDKGVKRIRKKKYPEKYEKQEEEKEAEEELAQKQEDEMAAVGLRDFTWILWVITLGIAIVGVILFFFAEWGGFYLIMALIGVFALSQVAILLHIHYKVKVKAFLNGEYKPKRRHLEKIAKKKERAKG